MTNTALISDALERADRWSPHLRLLMRRFPDVVEAVAASDFRHATPVIDPVRPIAQALRIAKGQMALCVAIGDLCGHFALEDVVGHLSDFADVALDHAVSAAIQTVVPASEVGGFAVIALGKHGSRELNYSSDVDPILLFDPERLPRRARDEPVESAVRIGQKLIELMQTRDGDGYVFRVDLRLRPNPEITPIVLPVSAAISYYESSALAWERAAFIRARACAGDVGLGQSFLDAVKPFVWRRGLDFGAIQEIRAMSHRIRDHHSKGQTFAPGYDLKRGRGGIRECEFFAQIHQMIHGGRDPSLRAPATIDALAALATADWITRDAATTLSAGYRLYRTIEHRLQMIDDRQTHSLPRGSDELDAVARLSGLPDGTALLALLAPHVEAVGRLYDDLDGPRTVSLPQPIDHVADRLAELGIAEAATIAQRITTWRSGAYRAVRTPAAHLALEAVLPAIAQALAAADDPLKAANRMDRMIERLPSAINLFRLLEAQPALLRLLTDILCHAPALADDLSRRADLLDGLISTSALEPVGSVNQIANHLSLDSGTLALEDKLDRIRQIVGEMRFALGAQIIAGASDPIDVAAGYARVAEAAIRVGTDATIAAFEGAHGRVPGSEFVIVALGRLGGAALTHASDLDLVFLFTGDFQGESDGARPLGTVHYFNRLAQRVIASLSVPTASGALYEIDTRLRPSGAKGPLCVSLEAFAHYQRDEAWTWEHMALTRARVVYGSQGARDETKAAIDTALMQVRDLPKLRADAAKMRRDMAAHKPPKTVLDVKLCSGGLVDLEFAIHVAQLSRRQGLSPILPEAIAALGLGADISAAHDLLTRFLVTMRLIAPDLEIPALPTQRLAARACGQASWDALRQGLDAAQVNVKALWQQVISDQEGGAK